MSQEIGKNKEILASLGLDERESAVYLALLEKGAMLPQHIALATGINRATLYTIFPRMIELGVVSEVKQGKRRLLSASSPETLYERFEERCQEIKGQMIELASIYRMQGQKPQIEIYEGLDGLKKVFLDTLNSSEICYFTQMLNFNEHMKSWILTEYVPARIKKRIKTRAIVPDAERSVEWHKEGKDLLREARYVPWDKFHFRMECMIYGDKASFITCEKGGPLIGIIIESRQLRETLSAMFELAWMGAEQAGEHDNSLATKNEKNWDKSTGYLEARVGQYGLIRSEEGKVLALERSRSKTWSMPGGRLNEDEKDQKQALYRELMEEIGVECEIGKVVDAAIISDQYQTKACTYFEAFPKDLSSITISPEHSRYAWIGREEIENYNFEYGEVKEVVRKFLNS